MEKHILWAFAAVVIALIAAITVYNTVIDVAATPCKQCIDSARGGCNSIINSKEYGSCLKKICGAVCKGP